MELKLDAVSSVNNLKVLVSGKKVTVTCARGDDAYMHAVTLPVTVEVETPTGDAGAGVMPV